MKTMIEYGVHFFTSLSIDVDINSVSLNNTTLTVYTTVLCS